MDKTTDQLLNLLEAEIDTTDSEPKYCIIDPDRREIYVDPDYQILGVESDENVERVWFQCPKIVGDSVDLSKYQLRVNYQNANRDKGQYIVTDITSEGDNIVFSWLLSRSVTAYVGQISFIICAVNVSSSDIKNEWNTTLAQAQVLTGLEVEPQDLPTTGDDLIDQLKSLTAQTQTFANTAQAASESAQDNADKVQQQADRVEDILENVPDFNEYDTLAQLEKSFYEGRKYNGMTYAGKTSDKGVQLHSVKGKTVQQTTNGYQLFDASKLPTKSQGGATVTNNGDGSFTISGSGNLTESISSFIADVTSEILPLLKKGTIFCNFYKASYPYCVFKLMDSSSNTILQLNNYNETSASKEITEDILSKTVKAYLQFYGENGGIIRTGIIKPMLYQDGDGTWELYTGGKPAPNPDYPMEIQSVEISEITAKNEDETKSNTIETSLTLAEGDTYENGQITRVRKQITFDGSSDEAWGNIDPQNGYGRFYTNLPNAPILNTENIKNILSNIFEIKNNISYWNNPSENCISWLASSEKGRIGVVFDGATDLTSFKSWLSTHPLTVEYELETPTTEELKIPTVPSYFPYTEVSTDNTLETDITWKVLADCDNSLKQEALEKRIEALEMNALGE